MREATSISQTNLSQIDKIAIVGGGNMGGAIARGIAKAGLAQPNQISVSRRSPSALDAWKQQGFAATPNNCEAVLGANIVVLAVKPYQTQEVANQVKSSIQSGALVISIATGVSVAQLEEWLGADKSVVRAMPNTAAEVGESVTALVAGHNTTEAQMALAQEVFSALGMAVVVDEAQMPALTALASCGIAHALRYIRAAQESAIEMGLKADVAAQIVSQTVKGAAQLILTNHSHPEVEIDKVCTPKGVTIAGINAMEHAGFTSAVMKGMMGSYNKIVK